MSSEYPLETRNNNSTDSETTDLHSSETEELREQLWETNERILCGVPVQKNTITCIQLTILFVFLIIVGGLIFHLIEHPHELRRIDKNKQKYIQDKQQIINILYNSTDNMNSALEVYETLQEHWKGFEDPPETTNEWKFSRALIFSFTIITTIGYGTFAPATVSGQMFLIVYALIGIPITGLSLKFVADRALYLFTWVSQIGHDKTEEAFNQFDSNKNGVLEEEEFRKAAILLGFDLKPSDFKRLWLKIDEDGGGSVDIDEFRKAVAFMHADVTEAAGQKNKIIITIAGLMSWIGIGTVFFTISENWRPDKTVYFLFVSLTTIGLGDFFPNTPFGLSFLVCFGMVGLGLVAVLLALLETLLKNMEKKTEQELVLAKQREKSKKLLTRLPIFASMSEKDLYYFVSKTTKLEYGPNVKLFKEGKVVEVYYIMLKGSVIVSRSDLQEEVRMPAPSLLLDADIMHRSCNRIARKTVRTAEDTMLLSIDVGDWQKLTDMEVINLKMLSITNNGNQRPNRDTHERNDIPETNGDRFIQENLVHSSSNILKENKRRTISFEW